MYRKIIALFSLIFVCSLLEASEDKTIYLPMTYVDGKMVLTQDMIKEKNTTFVIKHQYDLLGATINLPEGSVLKFSDDGKLSNGTIVGHSSSLITNSSSVKFNDISIIGNWNVAEVSSNLFQFSPDDPVLNTQNFRSMCMLTSDDNDGVIHVANGIYNIMLDDEDNCCFNLNSRTELIIDGNIVLEGNDLESYQMVLIKNKKHVKVYGTGTLIGDVETHLGVIGEWGMGIAILDSDYIEVRDLSIKNCWGDCIYIGQVDHKKESYSQKVVIENVTCQAGRRQGLSIIAGEDILIENCKFIDTGSIKFTAPGAGIDIEPNFLGETIVDNIIIDNCEFYGNSNNRDFLTYNLDTTACVILKNSKLKGDVYFAKGSYNITIDSCELNSVLTPQTNYGDIKIINSTITNRKNVDKSVSFENCDFVKNKSTSLLLWMIPLWISLMAGIYNVNKAKK